MVLIKRQQHCVRRSTPDDSVNTTRSSFETSIDICGAGEMLRLLHVDRDQ